VKLKTETLKRVTFEKAQLETVMDQQERSIAEFRDLLTFIRQSLGREAFDEVVKRFLSLKNRRDLSGPILKEPLTPIPPQNAPQAPQESPNIKPEEPKVVAKKFEEVPIAPVEEKEKKEVKDEKKEENAPSVVAQASEAPAAEKKSGFLGSVWNVITGND